MELAILLILAIAVIAIYSLVSRNMALWDSITSKKYLEQLSAGSEQSGTAVISAGRLIVGMPYVFKEHATAFVIDGDMMHIHDTVTEMKIGEIPRASITGMRVVDEKFHFVDMRVKQLMALGQYAYGFPKHRILKHSFLCISWQHNNIPCETVFEFTSREEAERAREGMG